MADRLGLGRSAAKKKLTRLVILQSPTGDLRHALKAIPLLLLAQLKPRQLACHPATGELRSMRVEPSPSTSTATASIRASWWIAKTWGRFYYAKAWGGPNNGNGKRNGWI